MTLDTRTPERVPSRRGLLMGGAAAATAVAAPVLTASAAEAARAARASTYRAATYRGTSMPTGRQRHMMNRMGCGYSRSTFARMVAAGSAGKWFEQQLHPGSVKEPALARRLPGWFPDMHEAPSAKWKKQSDGVKGGWVYAQELASYTMLRRMLSERQVLETMVEFWSNHLHVHAAGDLSWVQRASYDDLIRSHALGRFDEMLVAAELHPAMLLYLDNWRSEKNRPNENQGRELLELHTVGRAAGYTEQMVKDSAKILSGFTVEAFGSWKGFYDKGKHTTGAVQVLGFTSANGSPDGQKVTRDYLTYLAHHPATARTIARKLAVRFVSDSPSAELVDHLAGVFRSSGTDIRATLRALVRHPDFKASAGTRVRNPVEDFVATSRVLQVRPREPVSNGSFARSMVWVPESILVYQWPRPDGLPLGDAPWSSATRMLNSFRMHWSMTAGWWPTADVRYRSASHWLPSKKIRLDKYVDHLSRMMLGRASTSRLLSAVTAATGYPPNTVVTKDHPISTWLFVRVVGVLLDSPEHMSR